MSMGSSNEARLDFKTTSDVSSLESLQQSMRGVNQWLETLNQTMNRSMNLQEQMTYSLNKMANAQGQTKRQVDETTKSNNAFLDTIIKGIAAGAEFATGFFSVEGALKLVSNAFDFVTGSAEKAIMQMRQFLNASFDLATQAQQMEYLWQYQYGGPQNGGSQIASQLAAWIPNFAMNSPYKMTDIMGAVGPLSQLGLSFQGLQRYLPLISDLAATHTSIFGGGGMLPLPYAALAVMEATKGYSRRLLMELQIRPNELSPYGLKFVGDKESGQIANPEMFLPALEAFAKDKGYIGASTKIAHETWAGLWASLQDRQMSFMRRAVGENIPPPDAGKLSDDVVAMIKSGDIAGAMKAAGADTASLKSYGVTFSGAGLGKGTSVSSFQDALQKFAYDKFYSDWAHSGPNGGPAPEFREGSIFGVMLKGLQDFSQWWDQHQSTISQISKFIADVGGRLLELGRTSISNALTSAFQGFTKAFAGGEAFQGIGTSIMKFLTDPRNQDLIRQLGTWAGKTAGQGLTQFGQWAQPHVNDAISWLSDPKNQRDIQNLATTLSDILGGSIHEVVDDLKLLKKTWDDFSTLFADSSGKDSGPVKFFKDIAYVAGVAAHTIYDNFKRALVVLDDILQGLKLIGDALNGHLDGAAILRLDQKIFSDITSFITAGTVNITVTGVDPSKLWPSNGKHPVAPGPGQHRPGAGPNVDPNAYFVGHGPNVTQNNTYNIQGSTQWNVQQLINANARKVNNVQSRLWQSPGALAFGSVGLF